MADGCLGMMALGAKEVTGDDKFKLGKAYTLRKLADLEALGVTSENNPNLYRNVKEFYAEAGDGTELWLTGYAESETFANAFDKDNAAGAVALLKASNGKIRGLVAFKTPAEAYELTTTEGLDATCRRAAESPAVGRLGHGHAACANLLAGRGLRLCRGKGAPPCRRRQSRCSGWDARERVQS